MWIMIPQDTELPTEAAVAKPDVVVREAVEEHRAEAENPEGEDTPGHRAGPADPNPAEEEKERKIILHVRRDILSEHL